MQGTSSSHGRAQLVARQQSCRMPLRHTVGSTQRHAQQQQQSGSLASLQHVSVSMHRHVGGKACAPTEPKLEDLPPRHTARHAHCEMLPKAWHRNLLNVAAASRGRHSDENTGDRSTRRPVHELAGGVRGPP